MPNVRNTYVAIATSVGEKQAAAATAFDSIVSEIDTVFSDPDNMPSDAVQGAAANRLVMLGGQMWLQSLRAAAETSLASGTLTASLLFPKEPAGTTDSE